LPCRRELGAIESILHAGGSDGEAVTVKPAVTVKAISAQTGMSPHIVPRLPLRSLTSALRPAFDEGRVTAGIAEAAVCPKRSRTSWSDSSRTADRLAS
jgi:hypothetical protein